MPIREYAAIDPAKSCKHCKEGFEVVERIDETVMEKCPECGNPVQRLFSAPNVGASQSGLDQRAKNAGFTKLGKVGKGEYEKKY